MGNVVPSATGYRERLITEHMLRLERLTGGGHPSSELEVVSAAAARTAERKREASRALAKVKLKRIDRWHSAVRDLQSLQTIGAVRLSLDEIRRIVAEALTARDVRAEPELWEPASIPTVRDICLAVCRHYQVDLIDFVSHRRFHRLVRPRQVAIFLASKLTRNSLVAIGQVMKRDHSSVCCAIRNIRADMAHDSALAGDVATITARVREAQQQRASEA